MKKTKRGTSKFMAPPSSLVRAWAAIGRETPRFDFHRIAAYPPEDPERLRKEIEFMGGDLNAKDLEAEWERVYLRQSTSTGKKELARVKVWSDSVVETFTMDASYCLYGLGSTGVRTPWCGNRDRYLYEDYGHRGLRRFIVLPNGPEAHVELDGQQVPVARDAYVFAVDSSGTVTNCNDYENRYLGRGLDRNKARLAAARLEEVHPWVKALEWIGPEVSVPAGVVEDVGPWLDAGFSADEIPEWAGYARRFMELVGVQYQDRLAAKHCELWKYAGLSVEDARQWAPVLLQMYWPHTFGISGASTDIVHTASRLKSSFGAEEALLWWEKLGRTLFKRAYTFLGEVKNLHRLDIVDKATGPAETKDGQNAYMILEQYDEWGEYFREGFNARDIWKWRVFVNAKDRKTAEKTKAIHAAVALGLDSERLVTSDVELAFWAGQDKKRRVGFIKKHNVDISQPEWKDRWSYIEDLAVGESPAAYIQIVESNEDAKPSGKDDDIVFFDKALRLPVKTELWPKTVNGLRAFFEIGPEKFKGVQFVLYDPKKILTAIERIKNESKNNYGNDQAAVYVLNNFVFERLAEDPHSDQRIDSHIEALVRTQNVDSVLDPAKFFGTYFNLSFEQREQLLAHELAAKLRMVGHLVSFSLPYRKRYEAKPFDKVILALQTIPPEDVAEKIEQYASLSPEERWSMMPFDYVVSSTEKTADKVVGKVEWVVHGHLDDSDGGDDDEERNDRSGRGVLGTGRLSGSRDRWHDQCRWEWLDRGRGYRGSAVSFRSGDRNVEGG